jgi:hypothetical protein
MDEKRERTRRVLSEKLDAKGARIEHTHLESLKRLGQETGVAKSSTQKRQHNCWSLEPIKQRIVISEILSFRTLSIVLVLKTN